jgi:soluble lytic murein transglycosylase-like protein
MVWSIHRSSWAALAACLIAVAPAHAAQIALLRNGFSIRYERSSVVGPATRLYTNSANDTYVDVPTDEIQEVQADESVARTIALPQVIPDVVNNASQRYHLDPDLVNSVIRAESGFNPKALSPKGAQGLMQLMPQTATNLGVANAYDPGANVDGGARYLRELLERYDFDLVKALAAYNAGPLRVEQYHGVPPYRETQAYVSKVVRDFNRKKVADRKATQKTTKKPAAVKRVALAEANPQPLAH